MLWQTVLPGFVRFCDHGDFWHMEMLWINVGAKLVWKFKCIFNGCFYLFKSFQEAVAGQTRTRLEGLKATWIQAIICPLINPGEISKRTVRVGFFYDDSIFDIFSNWTGPGLKALSIIIAVTCFTSSFQCEDGEDGYQVWVKSGITLIHQDTHILAFETVTCNFIGQSFWLRSRAIKRALTHSCQLCCLTTAALCVLRRHHGILVGPIHL